MGRRQLVAEWREMPAAERRLWETDAVWTGMYAPQIAAWRHALPEHQFIVIDYAKLKANPQATIDQGWAALGVDSVALTATAAESVTSTPERHRYEAPSVIRQTLQQLYRLSVDALAESEQIDTSTWL